MSKIIQLSQGFEAIVDAEDFGFLSRFSWSARRCAKNKVYAVTARWSDGKYFSTYMHRLILNAPPNMEVDHINADTLDNQRSNLRICTHAQNGRNRRVNKGRRWKGVCVDLGKATPPFRSQLMFEGKVICIGFFHTEEEAARAYDAKAKEIYGEFAQLNFPDLVSPDRRSNSETVKGDSVVNEQTASMA